MTANAWFPRTTNGSNTWSPRTIAAAQRDFSATYSVFAEVSQDFSAQYAISLTGAWATITINATITLVAERPFTAQYTILNTATQDFDALYFLDGVPPTPPLPVFQDYSLVYAVDSEVTTSEVYRDFILFWSADGVAYRDFEAYYDVFADTATPGWTEEATGSETWTPVGAISETWTPVTNPTGSWA